MPSRLSIAVLLSMLLAWTSGCSQRTSTTTTSADSAAGTESATPVHPDTGSREPVSAPAPTAGAAATDSSVAQTESPEDMVHVSTPRENAVVTSPLIVSGMARGGWYFEGSFPVRLLDETGQVVALGVAQAQTEWTTDLFVPFRGTLTFAVPQGARGTLLLERSNPSGAAARASARRVTVRFR